MALRTNTNLKRKRERSTSVPHNLPITKIPKKTLLYMRYELAPNERFDMAALIKEGNDPLVKNAWCNFHLSLRSAAGIDDMALSQRLNNISLCPAKDEMEDEEKEIPEKQRSDYRILEYQLETPLQLLSVPPQFQQSADFGELQKSVDEASLNGFMFGGLDNANASVHLTNCHEFVKLVDDDKKVGVTQHFISDMFSKLALT